MENIKEVKIPFTGVFIDHRKFHVTFTPNTINTLVGKNGDGKTSMIIEMEDWLKNHNIPVFKYTQEDEGKRIMTSAGFYNSSFETFAAYFNSSEGQKIIVTCGDMIKKIQKFLIEHKEDEIKFVLFDGLDSGLSIDNIIAIREIFDLIIKDFPNTVIVNTTNNYEFTIGTRCINVKSGKDKTFKTYSSFVKFITK